MWSEFAVRSQSAPQNHAIKEEKNHVPLRTSWVSYMKSVLRHGSRRRLRIFSGLYLKLLKLLHNCEDHFHLYEVVLLTCLVASMDSFCSVLQHTHFVETRKSLNIFSTKRKPEVCYGGGVRLSNIKHRKTCKWDRVLWRWASTILVVSFPAPSKITKNDLSSKNIFKVRDI